jgi:hypothetical protein
MVDMKRLFKHRPGASASLQIAAPMAALLA